MGCAFSKKKEFEDKKHTKSPKYPILQAETITPKVGPPHFLDK